MAGIWESLGALLTTTRCNLITFVIVGAVQIILAALIIKLCAQPYPQFFSLVTNPWPRALTSRRLDICANELRHHQLPACMFTLS